MLVVGSDQRTVVKCQPLRSKQHFGGAQQINVIAAVERVAQDHMHELIEKEGRGHAGTATDEVEIGRL